MRIHLTIMGLLLTLAATAQQDNHFAIDAQLRTRGEYNNGAITPRGDGEKRTLYVNERARLSLGYERKDLQVKASVQHTGVWGQDNIKDKKGRVAMNEAWARLRFRQHFFAQVGRQQLSYDDERLLGTLDWNVAGNWHDALRLGYEQDNTKAHLIFAFNQNDENLRDGAYNVNAMPYKLMQTVWAHHDFQQVPLSASLLVMNIGRKPANDPGANTKYMQTFGTHLTSNPWQTLDLAASFYVQTGKTFDNKSIAAWMGSLLANYGIDPDWKVWVGYDYLSGNDGRNINQHAFDPLYGTHHRFYGTMDYFTGQLDCGLQDFHLGASTSIVKPLALSLDYHCLLTAEPVKDLSHSLGHELDLQLSMQLLKDVSLSAGYSVMFATETMAAVTNKVNCHKKWQDWLWLSLNVNPRIFSTKF